MDRGAWRATAHGVTELDMTEWLTLSLSNGKHLVYFQPVNIITGWKLSAFISDFKIAKYNTKINISINHSNNYHFTLTPFLKKKKKGNSMNLGLSDT